MWDVLLIALLGFLGSFGHCASMCGTLTVAFSLSQSSQLKASNWQSNFFFHLLLNLGRIGSYSLVGGLLGSLGSIIIASGQLTGIGSNFRQIIAIFTGILLIWLGLSQIIPQLFPKLPLIHPIQGKIHQSLSFYLTKLSFKSQCWTPLILGSLWGLFPCGFLYTAQIKAAETGSFWLGSLMMLAFGIGTMPMMLGVGISTSYLSADRRSQLFRLGSWVTLLIGILTLLRTEAMVDYTGHGALILLMLALVARPLKPWWDQPLKYRRVIGVTAFVLAIAHTGHMLTHALDWNLPAIKFMIPQHRFGILTGITALLLMMPAAITSNDKLQKMLGSYWRKIHLLCLPACFLSIIHTVLSGSHYWGELNPTWQHQIRTVIILFLGLFVLGMRVYSPVKIKSSQSKG
ncbi:MAG: sulfite exporter TauE/SafE family protein [Cyanobacteria bacterium J083]|nr:MAG: sulfite exporter TauE/SafE family protein [Cyanobacteria bacterium J083]